MKIGIVANTSWYIYNFRASLISELMRLGHEVHVFAPKDKYSRMLIDLGSIFHDWQVGGTNINPIYEFRAFFKYSRMLYKANIQIVLSYTPKGNFHSSLARVSRGGICIINNISGLGTTKTTPSLVSKIFFAIFRPLLRKSSMVFFQNSEDKDIIFENIDESKVKWDRLPGSGVDLGRFTDSQKQSSIKYDFLLSGRLLKEKGVYQYVEACKRLKAKYPHIRCAIAGSIEHNNNSGILINELQQWENEDIATYLGFTDDVRQFLNQIRVFVLPSYYGEGVPRGLLEAASMSKPIITTDHDGCRDAVDDRISGFLCRVKSSSDLAEKMSKIMEMSESEIFTMGQAGRLKMIREFDERLVLAKYIEVVQECSTYEFG